MTEISKARGRAGEFVNLFGDPMRTQPEFLETNGQSLRPLTERLRAEEAIFEGDEAEPLRSNETRSRI